MRIGLEEYSSEYKKFLAVFPFETSGISMSIDENVREWKMKFLRPIDHLFRKNKEKKKGRNSASFTS